MKDIEDFMNKNYRVVLQYDPDGYWIAEHPELSGCKADGETAQEALSSLDISRKLWIESCLANSLEVPEPQEAPQYSGRFVLRIPKSLHRELANEAEAEGVSLNSLVNNALASRHTRKEQTVPLVPQFAYPYMGGLYPAFCAPEKVNALLSKPNVVSMRDQQQSPWPNQNMTSENEQAAEKERQYA
jgi:predicted RNase H-like HicB family nuclease